MGGVSFISRKLPNPNPRLCSHADQRDLQNALCMLILCLSFPFILFYCCPISFSRLTILQSRDLLIRHYILRPAMIKTSPALVPTFRFIHGPYSMAFLGHILHITPKFQLLDLLISMLHCCFQMFKS